MNNIPRQKLCEIVSTRGRAAYDDPRLCKSLLSDMCGQYKRENRVLITAMEEGIIPELLNSTTTIPYNITTARLVKRLYDNQGVAEEFATWAVDSWALALGVITSERLMAQNPMQDQPPVQRPPAKQGPSSNATNQPVPPAQKISALQTPQQQVQAGMNPPVNPATRQVPATSSGNTGTSWIGAAIIGIICDVLVTLAILSPSLQWVNTFLLLATILFFGAAFGPVVGFFTAGGGYFIFILIYDNVDQQSFFGTSNFWKFAIAVAVVGLVTGGAKLLTKGKYNTGGALLIAEICGGIALFIRYIITSIGYNTTSLISTFILLPVLLLVWNALSRRKGSAL